jgi:hypothetical protein
MYLKPLSTVYCLLSTVYRLPSTYKAGAQSCI